MSAPGNSILIIALVAVFVACTGYAAGRIHQRRQTGHDREAAYRDGYETATRSVFSLAARVIGPKRSAVRASASVKRAASEPAVHPAPLPRSTPAPQTSAPASPAFPVGAVTPPAVGSPSGSGPTELGFPVPLPLPSGTVPEPPALGGVSYQRFPDPRTGGETIVLPDIRDLVGDAEVVKGRLVPRPSRPTSPASGLSFAPATSGSPASGRSFPPATGGSPAPAGAGEPVDPSGGDGPTPSSEEAGTSVAGGVDAAAARSVSAESLSPESLSPESLSPESLSTVPPMGRDVGEPVGASPAEKDGADGANAVPADASGAVIRAELGNNRRNVRRIAGHRAPDDEEIVDELTADDAASPGRHTVPDELVRASTYRLPPDRVFRAKVPDTSTLSDDPTTRLVPKPRQS
jgi:hypothetical protein